MGNQNNSIFLDDNQPRAVNQQQFIDIGDLLQPEAPTNQMNNFFSVNLSLNQNLNANATNNQQIQVNESRYVQPPVPVRNQVQTGPIPKKMVTTKIKTTTQCPICCGDIKKNCLIPNIKCKHEFHVRCLKSWLKKSDLCPLCRENIK